MINNIEISWGFPLSYLISGNTLLPDTYCRILHKGVRVYMQINRTCQMLFPALKSFHGSTWVKEVHPVILLWIVFNVLYRVVHKSFYKCLYTDPSYKWHKWHVQATSVISGEGIYEGMTVFENMVKDFQNIEWEYMLWNVMKIQRNSMKHEQIY